MVWSDQDVLEQIGTNIKLQRMVKGMNQKELAARVDKSRSYIAAIETRGTDSLSTIVDIAKALDCSLEQLIPGFDRIAYEQILRRDEIKAIQENHKLRNERAEIDKLIDKLYDYKQSTKDL